MNWLSDIKQYMGSNKLITIFLLITFVIVGLVMWERSTYKYRIETRYNTTQKANYNPLFALELLLQEQEKEVTSQLDIDLNQLTDDLIDFQSDTHQQPTLVINHISSGLSSQKYQLIMDWVKQGGHLITFNGRSNYVTRTDWKPVQNALKKGNQTEIDQALKQVNESYNNDFLAYLNVYKVELEEQDIVLDLTEIEEAKEKLQENLINLGIDPDEVEETLNEQLEQAKSKSKKKNASKDEIAKIIQMMVGRPDFALLRIQSSDKKERKSIVGSNQNPPLVLIKSNHNSYFNTDAFYLKHPEAKPLKTSTTASVKDMRWYIFQQLTLLNKKIKQYQTSDKKTVKDKSTEDTNLNMTNVLSDGALKTSLTKEEQKQFRNAFSMKYRRLSPNKMVKLLNKILKLPDDELVKLFSPKNNVMVDSQYGKGRITILSNSSMMANPQTYLLNKMVSRKELGLIPLSLITKQYNNLLTADHSRFSKWLMKSSHDVWLFPKVAVDSLQETIWKKARFALLGFLLFFFLWLWSLFNRFGRQKFLPKTKQSDILLYFQQIGRYAWSVDDAYQLSKVMHEQTLLLLKRQFSVDFSNENLVVKLQPQLLSLFENKLKQHQKNVTELPTPNLHKTKDEFEHILVNNPTYFKELLTAEKLQWVLKEAYADEYQTNAQEFVANTQTFWLLHWILK